MKLGSRHVEAAGAAVGEPVGVAAHPTISAAARQSNVSRMKKSYEGAGVGSGAERFGFFARRLTDSSSRMIV